MTHPLTATRNDYADGGEVQFYATALGIVAAENRFTRTGGAALLTIGAPGNGSGGPRNIYCCEIFTVVKYSLL